MTDNSKREWFGGMRQQIAAQADALKASAAMTMKQKGAEIREAIGPKHLELVKDPERAFGRDEGGEDVKRVVWTGHMVKTSEGHTYFGAAGLTESGYYRAAEVQVYGADEIWRWESGRHIDKEEAITSAEVMSAERLRGVAAATPVKDAAFPAERAMFEDVAKEKTNMPIPEHVKERVDAEMAKTSVQRMPVLDVNTSQAVENYGDGGKQLEAMREVKRQDVLQEKTPRTPEPER